MNEFIKHKMSNIQLINEVKDDMIDETTQYLLGKSVIVSTSTGKIFDVEIFDDGLYNIYINLDNDNGSVYIQDLNEIVFLEDENE